MSLNMFWFLPTHGDGHYLGTEEGSRPVDHGYLQQIAQAADRQTSPRSWRQNKLISTSPGANRQN